jgi:hypothetical protein
MSRERRTMTPAEVQAELRTIAGQLLAIEDRLRGLLQGLPRSPREDAMLEGKAPWDLATALRVDLDCVLEEQLRWVIETLEKASRATEGCLPTDSGRRRN